MSASAYRCFIVYGAGASMTLLSHAQTPAFRTHQEIRSPQTGGDLPAESVQAVPPRSPARFNPDPGQWSKAPGSDMAPDGEGDTDTDSDRILLFPSLLPREA